jgi:hypothetical protein
MIAIPPPEPPANDSPVAPETLIYRLIPTWQCEPVGGAWEFRSSAFCNASGDPPLELPDCMSVVLGDTLAAIQRRAEDLPDETPWAGKDWGVAQLSARYLVQDEHQAILRTPTTDERAHGDVRGSKNSHRRQRIKAHAGWLLPPATLPGEVAPSDPGEQVSP